MLRDIEYASADKVDLTTLDILRDDQLIGEIGASMLSLS